MNIKEFIQTRRFILEKIFYKDEKTLFFSLTSTPETPELDHEVIFKEVYLFEENYYHDYEESCMSDFLETYKEEIKGEETSYYMDTGDSVITFTSKRKPIIKKTV